MLSKQFMNNPERSWDYEPFLFMGSRAMKKMQILDDAEPAARFSASFKLEISLSRFAIKSVIFYHASHNNMS